MADLGLQNAFGGEAMAQQVRQRILDQLQAQNQQFQQGLETRASDRADRSLNQQDVLTRLKIQELDQQKKAAEGDQTLKLSTGLNDTIPEGRILPAGSPAVAPLQAIGGVREQSPTLPSTSTVGVMNAPSDSGMISGQLVSRTQNAGNPLQYVKLPSQKELTTTATQGMQQQDYQRKIDDATAKAEQAWEALRLRGQNADTTAELQRSKLELEQARLAAERAKTEATTAKTPQPQFFQDAGQHWHAVVFDKGKFTEIPLPTGYVPTNKSAPAGVWTQIKNALGLGPSSDAPEAAPAAKPYLSTDPNAGR